MQQQGWVLHLEIITQNEVTRPQKDKTSYDTAYMRNLKYDIYEFIYKTEIDSQIQKKNMVTKEKMWGG